MDIKLVKEEAEKEVAEEKAKEAKVKVKAQIKRVEDAKRVLKNEELVLEDLYALLLNE